MELYDLTSPVETFLAAKADMLFEPLGGTLELTPLCNMDCRMCYIKRKNNEVKKRGGLLAVDEWIRIADEMKKRGVLFLLLTGGEPLTYPWFEQLYKKLLSMGFVITVNTNGTLIDEKYAMLFRDYPCRRLNVTIYGKNDKTYEKLCRNPHGFTQFMRGITLLKQNNIPFRLNYSVVPINAPDLPDICAVAREFGVNVEISNYMFPPVRRENSDFCRMTPEEVAKAQMRAFQNKMPQSNDKTAVINTLNLLKQKNKEVNNKGLICRAGRSGFWISWSGELMPCGMFIEPKISLLENSFADSWNYIVNKTRQLRGCLECKSCKKRNICMVCAAGCLAETGSFEGKPQYLCDVTDKLYKLLLGYLNDEEKQCYLELTEG